MDRGFVPPWTVECRTPGRREILFAVLFGSAAEGPEFHDLDVAVYVDRNFVSPEDDLVYETRLSDELSVAGGTSVDARIVNETPVGFRYNVSRGKPLVVRDERCYVAFLSRTWSEFPDFHRFAMGYLRDQA